MLLFLLIGGVMVDRLPRGRVMLVSDILRGVIVAIVAAPLSFSASSLARLDRQHDFRFCGRLLWTRVLAIVPEIVSSKTAQR